MFPADHELGVLLDTLDGEYTVIMLSDPNEFKAYEPEFVDSVHMDLKRDQPAANARRKDDNQTERDTRPLFEKYQFFTPGKASSC